MEIETTGEATYCPEDNKLRLYVGRVSREEYLKLKSAGFKSTPKQDCDFVATWTTSREDIALAYGDGYLEDEDQSPADRAADRAERFAGYREKRTSEAIGHADSYDNGPRLHGHQSAALAERRAKRHDMQATRAVNQWSKAEYWQSRTAGVISHALHVSSPGVRMGRIKELEAELRKSEKHATEYATKYAAWSKVATIQESVEAHKAAYHLANIGGTGWGCGTGWGYKHPRPENVSEYIRENGTSIYSLMTDDDDPITGHEAAEIWLASAIDPATPGTRSKRWINHLKLRLAYENQMLEAQGGRAAHVEMIPGGWIGSKQIQKVNKSPATGRVTSVTLLVEDQRRYDRNGNAFKMGEKRPLVPSTLKTERLPANAYRAPTDEELAKFKADKAAAKKKAKATAPKKPSLINPTLEDAQKLQEVWNIANTAYRHDKPKEIEEMTQAQYSNLSKGSYSSYGVIKVTGGGFRTRATYRRNDFPGVAKFRQHYGAVIVLTDKPQKSIPAHVWADPRPAVEAEVLESWELLRSACCRDNLDSMTEDEKAIFAKGRLVRLVYCDSWSQFGLTDHGKAKVDACTA